MQERSALADCLRCVPAWVPRQAVHYIAHTETGAPIRYLARRAGCHASTVLRQIRTCETRRDDFLIDEAFRRLGRQVLDRKRAGSPVMETWMTKNDVKYGDDSDLSETRLKAEALRVLRRLAEAGAILAVAADMENAAVIRETESGTSVRTAIVPREVAEAMALKNWIACNAGGRVARYHITSGGRSALNRLVAESENRALGFSESQTPLYLAEGRAATVPAARSKATNQRHTFSETPLIGLARRRDKDGLPFLSDDLVKVGERLREDFELAQMIPAGVQNWSKYLTCTDTDEDGKDCTGAAGAARARVAGALRDLGPGLGDMVLRCCCLLEGLEKAEKQMGWSARSGKIVLRIALQRLKQYYSRLGERDGLIG